MIGQSRIDDLEKQTSLGTRHKMKTKGKENPTEN